MIFSNAADVDHTPYPGEDQDAFRLTIAPTSGGAVYETLTGRKASLG